MNKNNNSTFFLLWRFWDFVSSRQKIQIFFLLILMFISSVAEVLNVGAIVPFLGVLIDPSRVFYLPQLNSYFQYFGLVKPDEILLPMTLLFGFLTIWTNLIRILVVWAGTRIALSINSSLMIAAFSKSLQLPYIEHISRNTSETMAQIGKVGIAGNCIMAFFNFLGSAMMLFSILFAVLWIDPIVALSIFFGFAIIYSVIIGLTKNKLSRNSRRVADGVGKQYKIMQESYGAIRDVILGSTQYLHSNFFAKSVYAARRAEGNVAIISASPRYLMEPLGILLILTAAYFITSRGAGSGSAIPLLGAFALGAQRLLPVLQLCYSSWINIKGSHASMEDALNLMESSAPKIVQNGKPLSLGDAPSIELHNVSYRYSTNTPWVIKEINLSIPAGSKVGFIGQTGCGKTTLLDLIMGLLNPTVGRILINGVDLIAENKSGWQTNIAHVPQSIFLLDASIAENIAFGVSIENIDYERVRDSAIRACIMDAIDSWDDGLNTVIGERGIKLSGGQRQRIGIARALYKNATIIVFDEATSALDGETEASVMNEINSLEFEGGTSFTVLMIAHRLTTLKNCSKIIEMEDGKIKRVCEYKDILAEKSNFSND